MKLLDLFSGIGGFSLAARWMGWETVQFVERDLFCKRVLKYHWPNVPIHSDIKTFNAKHLHGTIDIISGGFPCQPYSAAGKRLGTEDDRHLWPEMLRIIREVQPSWVVGENVRGLTNWNGGLVFDQVQADLEAEGYEVLPFLLPACAVNAPHRRDRIWFVAYSGSKRTTKSTGWINESRELFQEAERKENKQFSEFIGESRNVTNAKREGLEGSNGRIEVAGNNTGLREKNNWSNFPTVSPICDRNDGLSNRLVNITFPKWRNESIKSLGNSIVPKIAFQLFKAIAEFKNI